jgi:transposase
MLVMAQIKYIKHLRDKEGKSIQAISDILDINWRTAKKYADCEDFNITLPRKRKRRRTVMDPYEDIIDTWLLEDKNLPCKQRHTAKRIYDRLVGEHGFGGAERTVREYVAFRRQQLGEEKEKFIESSKPEAHAQADFGKFHAFRNGCLTAFQYLVLSFPYSNAGFAQVLPGENSECLLEGLKWIFEYMGCVPRQILFDNLTAAVTLKKGDRKISEAFDRFCLHYGFKAEFCNINKPNEKGHVEGKIGYSRRNWFVPIPSIDDISAYNQQLFSEAEDDLKRPHYEKEGTLQERLSKEKAEFMSLPGKPFEVMRWETATVDKYGRIKLDKYHYHGVPAGPGYRVFLKASWDILQILNQDYEIIAQYPRVYHQEDAAVNWHVQFMLLSRKPGGVRHSVHYSFLPEPVQAYLSVEDKEELKQRLRLLSQLSKEYKIETLAVAITRAKENGQTEPGSIRHELYRLTNPEPLLPIVEVYTPACLHGYRPDLSQYDQLTIVNAVTDSAIADSGTQEG